MNETRTKRDLLETMEKLNKQSKKNKEQKEEAFTFLNTAVEIGNKIFCCIPVKLLKIDHEMYQRPLQKSFKHLLDNWDSDKCDPITVNLQISQKRNDRSAPAERPFRFKRRAFAKLTKALYRLSHTTSVHFNPVTVPSVSNA